MRDDFPRDVVGKVAERAAYLCSNPACTRLTLGPCDLDPEASTKIGVAAHICAASPGGPRYDATQTQEQRSSIRNAIWLCASCASLVDKNGGIDYPVEHLRRWKVDHEALMHKHLESGRRVVFRHILSGLPDQDKARRLIQFLQQRGVLFMPYQLEVPPYVTESVKEIRTFLTQLQADLQSGEDLDVAVDTMNHACRYFMNTTPPGTSMAEFTYALGALRKAIGLTLQSIIEVYELDVSGPLKDAIPK